MIKKPIIVANWKMQLPFTQALQYASACRDACIFLGQKATIVLCPSTTALYPIAELLKDSTIALGAQNCSTFTAGPYTGQESAQSLAQVGCSYCIIGHSEQRIYNHETDSDVATKVIRLLEQCLSPIICIGETHEQYKKQQTLDVLQTQLDGVFAALNAHRSPLPILLAYEPVWSIGSGSIPSPEQLQSILFWLRNQCREHIPFVECGLLYGGSVTDSTAKTLHALEHLDGFLLGGSSLDFQKFQKIVSLF